jgi:hypothetical protein
LIFWVIQFANGTLAIIVFERQANQSIDQSINQSSAQTLFRCVFFFFGMKVLKTCIHRDREREDNTGVLTRSGASGKASPRTDKLVHTSTHTLTRLYHSAAADPFHRLNGRMRTTNAGGAGNRSLNGTRV